MTKTPHPLDEPLADDAQLTLDRALSAHPDTFAPEDWPRIVAALRLDRARFVKAEALKSGEGEPPETPET